MSPPSRRISVASPTGAQWHIGHGDHDVVVCEVGATLRSYRLKDRPVLDGFAATEWSHGSRGQVLAPWPNRLDEGRYEFGGVSGRAPLDEPDRGNAIHGLVRWMPWTLQTRHQNHLSLRLQLHPSPAYPFSLLLELTYHVSREGLTVTTTAHGVDGSPVPFGLGFHPYLWAGPDGADTATLSVPGRQTLDLDGRGLPTGTVTPVVGTERDFTTGRPMGTTVLDTAYSDLDRDADGRSWSSVAAPRGGPEVALWADESFKYLMVYTGDTLGEAERRRRAVAVEPMTCPPNALRTGLDLLTVDPGQTWSARWGLIPR